jgi:hypothetical protein
MKAIYDGSNLPSKILNISEDIVVIGYRAKKGILE